MWANGFSLKPIFDALLLNEVRHVISPYIVLCNTKSVHMSGSYHLAIFSSIFDISQLETSFPSNVPGTI